MPVPQTEKQREVEARLKDMSDRLARRQGMSRRRFFQTAAGHGGLVRRDEPGLREAVRGQRRRGRDPGHGRPTRAASLSGQFVIDGHTHFLRDDTRLTGFVKGREAVGKSGWNKSLAEKEQTIDDLKYDNYLKEIYMDSDTKVALLSNSPSEVPEDWFIPQEQVFATRERVNRGGRLAAHAGAFHDHAGLAGLARPGR